MLTARPPAPTPLPAPRARDPRVAIVHDYLTQRGGAERVVLSLLRAFPDAPVHTALFEPEATFPEFASVDVRPLRLNRIRALRADHRRALPFLASAFGDLVVDADVIVCSSSGWAHGARTGGRKVVYCYNPARWLYQTSQYVSEQARLARLAVRTLRRPLERWDRRAASSAHRYLTTSSAVRERIRRTYGIEPEILPAPATFGPAGPARTVPGVRPGFLLCVSRLLPYKNVAAVSAAFAALPGERLVVVGTGPEEAEIRASAPANVAVLGSVANDELRWLYANAAGLVAASYEDYGLTPLEAGAFGLPVAVLRWGGFLDTVVEGLTGVLFEAPDPGLIAASIAALKGRRWRSDAIREHADSYSERRFVDRMRAIAREEGARATARPPGPAGPGPVTTREGSNLR